MNSQYCEYYLKYKYWGQTLYPISYIQIKHYNNTIIECNKD